MSDLAKTIAAIRTQQNLTIKGLSKLAEVSEYRIRKIELNADCGQIDELESIFSVLGFDFRVSVVKK